MTARGLEPLRHRPFRLLVGGQLASNFGDAFYAVALPWYVLATHGGALLLGTVLAIYGVARAAGLAVGGHASDRFRPWSVMMLADGVRVVGVGALAVLAATRPAGIDLLAPLAIVVGAAEGFFIPGSYAILPELLSDEELQAGNAITSGGTQLATLVGPALGGVAVAVVGPKLAFSIDAVTFVLSALSLAAIRASFARAPAAVPEGEGEAITLRSLLRSEPVVLIIFALTLAANLGSGGLTDVALPALAHGPLHAGADGYGALIASFAGGALLGTVAAARVGRLRRPAIVATIAFLIEAGFEAVVPYLGGTVAAAVMLACFGVLNGFANVLTLTAIQRWAPRETLGRLMGFMMLGAIGIFPVSVLLGGAIVHALGPAPFFPLAAGVLAIVLLVSLSSRTWRQFGANESTLGAP